MSLPRGFAIRRAEERDQAAWSRLRAGLWNEQDADELAREAAAHFAGKPIAAVVFVAEAPGGALVGMVEAGMRTLAEGCHSSPVPFVEGWYVAPEARGRSVGRALMAAVEEWALEQGFTELGSDTTLDNVASHAAHGAVGFEIVERLVCFRKDLHRV